MRIGGLRSQRPRIARSLAPAALVDNVNEALRDHDKNRAACSQSGADRQQSWDSGSGRLAGVACGR
jgi:hypothetical protein